MKVKVMAEIEVEAGDTELGVMQVKQALSQAFSGSEPKAWLKPNEVASRDPRLDPEPGDRVKKAKRKGEIIREVRRVESGMVQYVADGESKVCKLSTWLNWCLNAKAIEREANGQLPSDERLAGACSESLPDNTCDRLFDVARSGEHIAS